MFKRMARSIWESITHLIGRLTGRYYFEDFVRVYPGGILFDRFGRQQQASENDQKNFLNHRKLYRFAAQFAAGRQVADIGCGSGYGCALLAEAGATAVFGADLSHHSLHFARRHFGKAAQFSEQSITDLADFASASFDLTTSSEVLEHIKEYGKEDVAVAELKRITRQGGIVLIATPNSENLRNHGFTYDEMDALIRRHFSRFVIFENALVPTGKAKGAWEQRRAAGRVGTIITEAIRFDETVLVGESPPELKTGVAPGRFALGPLQIDTALLHNTHSWAVVGLKD
jgi:SAM-dependent methyltransferase